MSKKKEQVNYDDPDWVPSEQDIRNFDPDEKFTFDEKEITLDVDVSNIIAIDNLPVTTEDKAEKMESMVKQIIETKIDGVTVVNSQIPIDYTTNKTKGYIFVELATKQQADKAVKELEGHAFGKGKFHVIPFSDFDKYESVEDGEFQETPLKPLKEREFLRGWLLDDQARDQFVVRHDTVEVYWHDVLNKPQIAYRREKMSEDTITWSPYGSYLVTWHEKGIALWGGDDMKFQGSFSQKNVRLVDFSPRESFVVTMNENVEDNIVVFDTLTQKKKRILTAPVGIAKAGRDGGGRWPIYKWSHDEKYLARQGRADDVDPRRMLEEEKRRDLNDSLYIYDTSDPTMPLLGKKAVRIEGLRDFAWMPSQSNKPAVLAYVAASESDTVPSKVALLEFPKMREIRTQPFFKATNIRLIWNESGDYLAVLADREVLTKGGKTENTTVEVFMMNSKGIPIETIEFADKIYEFKWEPRGKRFVAIHGDATSGIKRAISFYTIRDNVGKLLKKYENKVMDRAYWSPRGVNVVLSYSKTATVPLEFYDVDDVELVGTGEHFGMTGATWDPTGRYFTSFVSSHTRPQENGYILWTFLGTKLHHATFDKMWEFEWRPRPPTLLTANDLKKVQRELPQLKKQYQKERSAAQQKVEEEGLRVRKRLWNDFEEVLERLKAQYEQMRPQLAEIRGYSSEDEYEVREEVVEEVVSREEELVEE